MSNSSKNKPPAENPLVEKALSKKVRAKREGRKYTIEEMDLFIRWYHGELETSQVAHAMDTKGQYVHGLASRALKQGIEDGRLTIVWKGQG